MSAYEPILPSIRARAVELGDTPDLFDQPYLDFATPGEYKREADAHLALCIDKAATKIVQDVVSTKDVFVEEFQAGATALFPNASNDEIDPYDMGLHFAGKYSKVFSYHPAVREVVYETLLGLRTQAVCQRYDGAVRSFLWDNPHLPDDTVNHGLYLTPDRLIHNGLGELQSVLTKTVMAMAAHPGTLAEREAYVRDLPRIVKRLSSLSINQLVEGREPSVLASSKHVLELGQKIGGMRSIKTYKEPVHEVLRPHGMCPALPKLPANERVHGGSGLERLAQLGTELIIATNLHALGINDPEHPIVGRNYSKPV